MPRYFNLFYIRPKKVDLSPSSGNHQIHESQDSDGGRGHSRTTSDSDDSVNSGKSSGSLPGIPPSLSFDNIIESGTCPPMTTRDFMNYLVYVEHAAENLQFYLWYKDYEKRFEAARKTDTSLAPEWTQTMQDNTVARLRKSIVKKQRAEPPGAQIFKGTDFEKQPDSTTITKIINNPFRTPPRTPEEDDKSSSYTGSGGVSSRQASYKMMASEAFHAAGVGQPFTIQPFREEINRVIATYIMDDAPRQLNLASWEQRAAVQALSQTTHPTAMRGLIKTVESSLRRQAHPNFVRWSICNGNPARVYFARGLGSGLILLGVLAAILITLSNAGRGYRALAAIAWVLGISTLVAAYKGMCVVLHGMHHHHVRPWELFDHDDEELGAMSSKLSFESFGSSNSYEDEPWVIKYEKRNIVRKVFDRERWIQEPALRHIQDIIFVQAMLAAVLVAGVLATIFVFVPGGKLF